MNAIQLSDAMEYLSEDILLETQAVRQGRRQSRLPWLAAAACLGLALLAAMRLLPWGGAVQPGESVTPAHPAMPERALIYTFPGEGGESACYRAPEAGECLYSLGLQRALKMYEGRGVAFLLQLDVTDYSEGACTPLTEEKLTAEYRRLAEAGATLFRTPLWTYEGAEGRHVPYTAVTVMVTAEELAAFPARSDYGYFFSFPCNGDGSAPETAPGEALVLPDW